MTTRIIALGQAVAGDDGVGFAVYEELQRRELGPNCELVRVAEASALLDLLATPKRVVIIDAAVAREPGHVLVLDPDDLATAGVTPMSSHGLGVAEVTQLARTLHGEAMAPEIRVVAITILRPGCYREGLSDPVRAAVPRAADVVCGSGQ